MYADNFGGKTGINRSGGRPHLNQYPTSKWCQKIDQFLFITRKAFLLNRYLPSTDHKFGS